MEENIFAKWDKRIRGAEASFVNLISSIAPWGAPIPVAFMTYIHMIQVLEFPFWVSIVTAIVVEILGFSTVSTIIGLWNYNRKFTDEKRKSPIGVVVFAFIFYLSIVLTVNVLLDATHNGQYQDAAIVVVRGLLTLLTIPAALILGVRTLHQEILTEAHDAKKERAFKRQYGDQWFEMLYGSSGSVSRTEHVLSGKKLAVMTFLDKYYQENGEVPKLVDIMKTCGVAKSTASEFRREWADTVSGGE